ncbi:Asp-tRNA(Asn)/Glu-tRNA(Gln) amidotransferase subunit GatA [Alkaliphilus serpentinus]|uniref:Glutamyl-tRNA(Gln) amidotransferase subunit A n=1 Tax=Alkaliphilus serpentinus TaxID=1482731 RepID=A0A833HQW3_9FIRM|nr:Asp-tRNA(Asn)/Glu-tRNA(Gln) amidotransferase subunit GatA [Alkaliphilus serpentinus]KAB3532472.1 Asp-tRNA(Asn)/Glu-tRNA(Gln) amidotransferase subunit GatA [Alkaliphilus serpentinus]
MTITIDAIKSAIEGGERLTEEIILQFYKRIEEREPEVNGFLTLCRDEALERARSIDQKRKKGEKLGRLAGVPVAIKDNISTDGMKTTCASRMLEDYIPPYDATVIKKLWDEDAIIIGKTNMDEFAMGSSNENSAFKVTSNPWDTKRVPGGSSGGSAAVVAAEMSVMSLGSDTGGSIRQPAAFCGVVGLKPTYGLVSRFGLIAFASSLDQIGPITRTVKDSAISLEVLQGHDPMDSTSYKGEASSYLESLEKGVKGLRMAVPKEFFHTKGLDPEIADSIRASIERYERLGAIVEEVSLPLMEESLAAYYLISSAEASSNLARFDGVRYGYRTKEYEKIEELMEKSRSEAFGKEVKRRIMMGTYALSSGYYDAYYNKAQKLRKIISLQYQEIFKDYDLIISPTTPILPFLKGEKTNDPLEMYLGDIYTININLAELPALSMPCGFSKEGLPIGLQLIGNHYSEATLLRAAHQLEQEIGLKSPIRKEEV